MTQPTSAEHQYTSSSGLRSNTCLVRPGDAGQVAAGRVQDALRLGGRAATCRARTAGARRRAARPGSRRWRRLDRLVVEDVAALRPSARRCRCGARRRPSRSTGTSPRNASTAGLMSAALPLRRAWSTVISAFASENSIRSFTDVRREAAEDDVVRRADARAGEHRHGDLGDHRQVDPDDVARLDRRGP